MSPRRFESGLEAANDDKTGDAFGQQNDLSFGLLQDASQTANLEIVADGSWRSNGQPIASPELLSFLGGMLQRSAGGRYVLELPSAEVPITVEDVPFVGEELFVAGGSGQDQVLSVRTNLDEIVTIDKDHSLRIVFDDGGDLEYRITQARCYVMVRPGLEARLRPRVLDALSARGVELRTQDGSVCFGVWSSRIFFPLGCLDEHGVLVAPL